MKQAFWILPVLLVLLSAGLWWRQSRPTKEYLYFKQRVVGVLNRNCTTGCHGAPPEIYWRDARSPSYLDKHAAFQYLIEKGSGTIQTEQEVRIAYERCREQVKLHNGETLRRIDYRYPARFSPLVRMGLARTFSSALHAGGDVFVTPDEEDFRALLRWVEMEIATHPEREAPNSHPGFIFFRNNVMPVLAKKNCLGANCHASQAFNDLRLDPGINFDVDEYGAIIKGVSYESGGDSSGLEKQADVRRAMGLAPMQPGPLSPILQRFSDEMVMNDRIKAMGAVIGHTGLEQIIGEATNFVTLGDVNQSKILLKNLPLSQGGILHKGGNNFFVSRSDPDFQTLVEWLKIEKTEAEKSLRSEGEPIPGIGVVRGILFVRARPENKRRFFEVDTFLPGARLFILPLKPGEAAENASASPVDLSVQIGLTGNEDIRSPAVRYDAKRILFSMRRNLDDNSNIYEIALNDDLTYRKESFRRLTFGPRQVNGLRVHYVYPEYMPDPDDPLREDLSKVAVMFASNLAGEVTPSELRGILGEADGGTVTTILDLQRPEASGAFAGRRVSIVNGENAGRSSRIIATENHLASGQPAVIRVDPPFPHPVQEGIIYVIEPDPATLPGFLPAYDIYRMRYSAVGQEEKTYDETLNRITFTSDQDLNPAMRTSGEVMFTSLRILQYRAGKPIYNGGLFRAHPNGSNFHPHNMNRSGYPLVTDNREMPSGLEARIIMDPRNLWGGGALAFSDHQFGIDIEPSNPVDSVFKPYKASLTYQVPPRGIVRAIIPGEGSLSVDHSSFRFLRASMPFFPDTGPDAITPTGVSPGGFFRDPYPMPAGSVLVSYSPHSVDHLDPHANPDTDIYLVRPGTSLQKEDEFSVGDMKKNRIAAASSPNFAEIYPRPIVVRLKEAVIEDLFEQEKLGPPQIVRGFKGYAGDTLSFVECYDYYTLDQLLFELAPVSKRFVATPYDWQTGKANDPSSQIKYVRAIAVVPLKPSDLKPVDPGLIRNHDPSSTSFSNGIHTLEIIAGEFPLPEDGSFYLNVPPGLPFYVQGLNADRMAVRTLDKLFYTVPGEKFKMSVPREMYPMICGGCHGSISGDRSDVLRHPDAVTSASKVSATWDVQQRQKKLPLNNGIVSKLLSGVDFVHDIQPILDKKCAGCHSGDSPAAGLSLTGDPTRYYNDAYESLMQLADPSGGDYSQKKYVDDRDALAIKSYLIEKLLGRELQAAQRLRGEIPHPIDNRLTEAELLTFIRWVDIGAPFHGFVPQPEKP